MTQLLKKILKYILTNIYHKIYSPEDEFAFALPTLI